MTSTAADTGSPPRTQRVNPTDSALQSTPQSRGSATVSESIGTVGVLMSDIRPWIARDVEKFVECSIDEMLKVFLANCIEEPPHSLDKTHLFKECLESVLPICNGEFQAKGLEVEPSTVKSHLAAYSANYSKNEKELYPDFVKAVNTAFLCLQLLNVRGVRPCSSSPVYFHVNDPSTLKQIHQGQESHRKPDIVLVSERDALEARGSEEDISDARDIPLNMATEHPPRPFRWRSIRTFAECKTSKRKMEAPPETYTFLPDTPLPKRPYLRAGVHSHEPGADSAVPSVPTSSRADSKPPPCEPTRRSARQQEMTSGSNRKRTSEQLELPDGTSKRQKSEPKASQVIMQAGSYAAEMFAAHCARQHVIGFIVVDDLLFLWYYDRQHAIQCSAFNFVQDLPRLLVLLFAFQRFEDRHWGLNPHIDPEFGIYPRSHEMVLRDEQGVDIDVTLELLSEERTTHFGLNGRATNLFPVTSKTLLCEDGLVAKVFWVEESRKSEPEILKKVYEIAERNEDVKGHVPHMVCYQAFWDTSTAVIRQQLGLNIDGSRVLYLIIFRKLKPITKLSGNNFLHTWWATVKCHRALWQNGVYHRDVSPSNLMFRLVDGKIIGVLNDFDLASIGDGPTGTERTGTVPFMAIALLGTKAVKGEVKHRYEHDVESFIWVLTWISLRYDDGELKKDPPLDEWLKCDTNRCREKKNDFLITQDRDSMPAGAGHEKNLQIANKCLDRIGRRMFDSRFGDLDDEEAFQKLFPVELFESSV